MSKAGIVVAVAGLVASLAVAMPSRSDMKKVQGAVNEIMSADIQAMKAGKTAPEAAAAKAEGFAAEVTDEASKFLLLKGAFGLYVQGGKYDEALAALDRLSTEGKDVPDQVLAGIIREKLKRISKKDGGAIFARYERIGERVRCAGEIAQCEKALKANPSDKDARRKLALCHATMGEWKAALDEFAQVGGTEAEAAKAESAGKLGEAADLWWGLGDDSDLFREHAAALYTRALGDGKLKGLKKALAEKRVAEMGPVAAKAGSATPAAEPPSAVAENVEPAAEPAAAAARPVAKLKTMKLDLGGGVAIEMIECPAGEFTMGYEDVSEWYAAPHKVRISRPFWLSKHPVTRAQWRKVCKTIPEFGKPLPGGETMPVTGVDIRPFGEFARFLGALSSKFKRQMPRGYVFRLPTEAEWEYACKANEPEDSPYRKGKLSDEEVRQIGSDADSQRERNQKMGVTDGIGIMFGSECGQFPPNGWGFFDMYGNVIQAVLDSITVEEKKVWAMGAFRGEKNWYAVDAVDPLHYPKEGGMPLGRGWIHRWAGRNIAAGRLNITMGGLGVFNRGFRLALGPDLLKEKKLK